MALCRRVLLYQSTHFQGFPFDLTDGFPWAKERDSLGLEKADSAFGHTAHRQRHDAAIQLPMRNPPLQCLKVGTLSIISNHPVLNQVARDIFSGIDEASLHRKNISLYIGTHRKFGRALSTRDFKIGLQTEHYFDDAGQAMWRRQRHWRTIQQCLRYDAILDLSIANKPHYAWLPKFLREKVTYGPYIFPCHPVNYCKGTQSELVFFGSINERRASLLEKLPEGYVAVLGDKFGGELRKAILQSRGVLNLHYVDRIYTEYPRLLSCYLSGKVFFSEKLSRDLQAGIDYGLIDRKYTDEDIECIYQRFKYGFAYRHKVVDFINRIAKKYSDR